MAAGRRPGAISNSRRGERMTLLEKRIAILLALLAQESEELLMLLQRGLSAKQAEMLLEVPAQPRDKE